MRNTLRRQAQYHPSYGLVNDQNLRKHSVYEAIRNKLSKTVIQALPDTILKAKLAEAALLI
jgi:hypothetical protein